MKSRSEAETFLPLAAHTQHHHRQVRGWEAARHQNLNLFSLIVTDVYISLLPWRCGGSCERARERDKKIKNDKKTRHHVEEEENPLA
jgi:hypothetical protein